MAIKLEITPKPIPATSWNIISLQKFPINILKRLKPVKETSIFGEINQIRRLKITMQMTVAKKP